MRLQYQQCADYWIKFRQQQFACSPYEATVVLKQQQSVRKCNVDNMSISTFTSILKANHWVVFMALFNARGHAANFLGYGVVKQTWAVWFGPTLVEEHPSLHPEAAVIKKTQAKYKLLYFQ